MNPAIVAAALNQWGLLNGMQPNQGNNDQVKLFALINQSLIVIKIVIHFVKFYLHTSLRTYSFSRYLQMTPYSSSHSLSLSFGIF
jgi:hypothetical protein